MYQGERYRGPAVITQGDLKVAVECEYEVNRVDGVVDWNGRFSGAASASEPGPGAALLVASGKRGAILVVSALTGTGSGRFEGDGPPPA